MVLTCDHTHAEHLWVCTCICTMYMAYVDRCTYVLVCEMYMWYSGKFGAVVSVLVSWPFLTRTTRFVCSIKKLQKLFKGLFFTNFFPIEIFGLKFMINYFHHDIL